MSFTKDFIPQKPFPAFKWKWASLQCTEGINDPVILLGVLFRMRKLENKATYSSEEFANEMRSLAHDIKNTNLTHIDLARRTGERNLIRNSGQYWKAVGLIPAQNTRGIIQLTDFGRQVADREISQAEFAATTIQTFCLPNPIIQSQTECDLWKRHHLKIYPLLLLLKILRSLSTTISPGVISKDELIDIIIPLSGYPDIQITDYVNFIQWYRKGVLDISKWPKCTTSSNDHRIAREFLLFLSNYGYIEQVTSSENNEEQFAYNSLLDTEITKIIHIKARHTFEQNLDAIRASDVVSDIEHKRVQFAQTRPNQARFRKDVLGAFKRCVISNVTMPEVLEAAHIKPYRYNGADTVANGFCMRMDIHQLFDAGHLRIDTHGAVMLSPRARMDYGATIPPQIVLPDFIDKDFVRWRWDNYNGM